MLRLLTVGKPLQDTGEVLMPQDMKKAQTYGGRQICFEEDEVKEIKRFDASGERIIQVALTLFLIYFYVGSL